MTYIALLRGINVGGNNKIPMSELKEIFEQAGMHTISTYINSGNVLFQSDESNKTVLAAILEEAIALRYGFAVKVLVLAKQDMLAIAKALPKEWTNDTTMKCDVLFLWESIDSPDIVKEFTIKAGIDTVKYVPGAVLWAIDRKQATKSGLYKIVGTPIYKQMTVRNCNTLRRLVILLNDTV